jgi:hypothetical protein
MYTVTKARFENLVTEACSRDSDLRHEIERRKVYGAYTEAAEIAYDLFARHFLSLREAFGLTERGYS